MASRKSILVILDQQKYRDLYELNFKTYLNADVSICADLNDVENYFINNYGVSLIFMDAKVGGQDLLQKVATLINEKGLTVPVIAIGDPKKVKVADDLSKDFIVSPWDSVDDVKGVIKKAAEILQISAKDMAEVEVDEYFPIPLTHFYFLKEAACSVFIKIGKDDHIQYIKRIHHGEGLEDEVLDRYAKSGVKNLYIESESRLKFVNAITASICGILEDDEAAEEDQQNAERVASEVIQSNIQALGITPEIVTMANTVMKSLAKDFKKHRKINSLFKSLIENKNSYTYNHMKLTNLIGLNMLKHMEWGQKEQEKTLGFVCMFHDIALPSDECVKIHSEEELRDSDIADDLKAIVKTHAQKSAEMIHAYPKIPMGADIVIRQHHGMMNGVGFSEFCGGNLSPLSIIFIVAEDTADHILKSENKALDKGALMAHLNGKYSTSRFKKMIDALEKSLI